MLWRIAMACLPGIWVTACAAAADRPNVVLIVTDDQGYGDFGFAGQPVLDTPHLDALAAASSRVEPFYVSPVCAPTRACLMTGRYNYRTRVVDTYIGRAMMEPAERTIAELLRDAGWATGIFGKWHLGDCYPMRPQDQGFDTTLVHRGGGIGQPSDPPAGARKYTNPVLFHDGVEKRLEGYCTDIYFDHAMQWMRLTHAAGRPFFCYLPTNAPHGPFHDVPAALHEKYRGRVEDDKLARIFAMIENIDDNVGRLLAALDDMNAADDTLVLFMLDNGPQTQRYVSGFAGHKGTVREGGIRSPFLARWPGGGLEAGRTVERIAAHIDVLPTVLEACGVTVPDGVALDGRSLWPLLTGRADVDWAERPIVIQAHRGDHPVAFHNFMLRRGKWKLLRASGFGRERPPGDAAFELYDLDADPLEQNDLSEVRPVIVRELAEAYVEWWRDVSSERADNFEPPRIVLGTPHERRTVLTRQDWRRLSDDGGWNPGSRGRWLVEIAEAGSYDVLVRFAWPGTASRLEVRVGNLRLETPVPTRAATHLFEDVHLPAGPTDVETTVRFEGGMAGALQVELVRRDG